MTQIGIDLSKRLRDPKGEHKCDLVIALTHARFVTRTYISIRLLTLWDQGA